MKWLDAEDIAIALCEKLLSRSLWRLSPMMVASSGEVRSRYSHCSASRAVSALRRASTLDCVPWAHAPHNDRATTNNTPQCFRMKVA